MSEQRYDIFFRGECLDGHSPESVQQAVGQLFKAGPDKTRQLFSGKILALKRNLDKPSAIKFKKALESAGAKIYIKAAATADQQSLHDQATRQTGEQKQHGGLDILPVGSDVLAADERRQIESIDIDLSHLQLESPFSATVIDREPPPPAPDTSHLTAAEVGIDIFEGYEREELDVEAPDTSHISLAEAGEDLQRLVAELEAATPPAPETDHISLAEPGVDIDPSEKTPPPPPPDVSHIKINEQS